MGTNKPQKRADEIADATITYSYDINDNLTRVDYPDAGSKVKALDFTYNEYNWIMKVTAELTDGTERDVRDYVYGPDGKISEIKDHKGVLTGESGYVVKKYSYDQFERTTEISYMDSSDLDTVKESYKYTYDKNSNIISEEIYNDYPESEQDKVHEIRTHEYNSIGQLIQTQIEDKLADPGSNATIYRYSYDSVGNRVEEIRETGLTAGDHEDAEDSGSGSDEEDDGETDSASILPFTAVAEADTVEEETDTTVENQLTTTTFTYNSLNQLVSSSENTEGVSTSEKTLTYDKNGNQLSESDSITGESRTMTYDAAGNMKRLVAKKDDAITLTQENVYNGNGQRIRKTEADDTINYYYQGANVLYTTDGTGALSAQNLVGISENTIATTRGTGDSEAYYVYNKDIRESTTNLVDSSGDSEVSYEYTDYGETEITGNEDFYNEICYTGGIYDASTGIYYLNARYYDPENANFLSQDSYRGEIGDPESLNLYAYCNDNPIIYTDPTGHFPWIAVGIAVYRGYKVYKTAKKVYKTAKTVKKVYKGAKTIKKISKPAKSAVKKVTRTYKKPKSSKKLRKATNKTYKPSRLKADKKKSVKRKVSQKKKDNKQVGSYTIKFSNGKEYHGKGSRARMNASAKRLSKEKATKAIQKSWRESPNNKAAFISEHMRIKKGGGPNPKYNYNRINSPGKKYLLKARKVRGKSVRKIWEN